MIELTFMSLFDLREQALGLFFQDGGGMFVRVINATQLAKCTVDLIWGSLSRRPQ